MFDGLLGNKPQPVKMFSTCFYYFTVKNRKNVDDRDDGGARSSFNVCVCVSGSDRPLPGSRQQPDQRRRWKVSEQHNSNFLLSKPTKPLFLN